jgi:crossover junction endodeoxyribonuclease RuvC
MTRILALDLSLTATGWATNATLFDAQASGVLSTAKLRGMERLAYIRSFVEEAVREVERGTGLGFHPIVVLEGYSFGSKGRAVINLGELGGVIRLALRDRGTPYVEVPPANVKKYATGRGNAPKEEVLAAAIRRLNFAGHDHNEADAWWLRAMALDHYGEISEPIVPKAQRAELAKVAWPKLERRAVA